jgi:hypothetical protein
MLFPPTLIFGVYVEWRVGLLPETSLAVHVFEEGSSFEETPKQERLRFQHCVYVM